MPTAVPSLTYPVGGCSDAIELYTSLLPNCELLEKIEAPEGGVLVAKLMIGDLLVYMADGNRGGMEHDWDFTPGVSLLVEVGDDASVVRLHDAFIEDGDLHQQTGPFERPPRLALRRSGPKADHELARDEPALGVRGAPQRGNRLEQELLLAVVRD